MTDADTMSRQGSPDDDETLRKRLLARVGVAGALIVALLGGLALFDSFYVREEARPPARIAAVKPIVPAERAEAPVEPPAEEAAKEAAKEVIAAPAAEPERSEPPREAPKARAERPLTVPATARPAMLRPGEPAAAVRKPEPAREIARVLPPQQARERHEDQPAPASRPIARAMESARQFVLQMGVFNNVANAEELRAKLELAGVPAQIEARVQVGPFASREDAEQAREKLRALGMDPGLIVAARK